MRVFSMVLLMALLAGWVGGWPANSEATNAEEKEMATPNVQERREGKNGSLPGYLRALSVTAQDEDPRWLFIYDVNGDDVIDLYDLVLVAQRYGSAVSYHPPKISAFLCEDVSTYNERISLYGAYLTGFEKDLLPGYPRTYSFAVVRSYQGLSPGVHKDQVRIYRPPDYEWYWYLDPRYFQISNENQTWVNWDFFRNIQFPTTGRYWVEVSVDDLPLRYFSFDVF